MASIRIKSGTRAQLDAAAAASLLAAREPYFIVDEGRFAVGTGASAYTAFAKEADVATTRVWASGMTVAQGERVISPLDWEEYRRTTTSGSGTTDPADDLTNYIALTYTRVTALGLSTTISNNGNANPQFFANGAVKALPGVIAVGARVEIFSASGRGVLAFLGFMKTTTGGGRFEVFIDGRSVFDSTIQSAAADVNSFVGALGAGAVSTSTFPAYTALPSDAGLPFRRSVSVIYTPAGTATVANTTLAYIMRSER
ncbi:MAG: hypothetical protein ACN6PP_00480 [Delftia tsuruhatensis]